MKLYHSPQTRSVRPRWLLEELGAPYELVTLDMPKQDHKTAGSVTRNRERTLVDPRRDPVGVDKQIEALF